MSTFNGKKKCHIRYYGFDETDETKLLPSKKGIALNKDEWLKLKELFNQVDAALAEPIVINDSDDDDDDDDQTDKRKRNDKNIKNKKARV